MTTERLKILQMLDEGLINADQAAQLLQAIADSAAAGEPGVEPVEIEMTPTTPPSPFPGLPAFESPVSGPPSSLPPVTAPADDAPPAVEPPVSSPPEPASPPRAEQDPAIARWRNWWYLPLAAGILVTAFSAWLLYLGGQREWAGFWLFCLWFPLLLGILVTTLAALSRSAPWLHLRVHTGKDEWPRQIAFSFPLPLGLASWGLRAFGRFIPKLDKTSVDEIVLSLESLGSLQEPLHIQVDEGDKGEHVEIFIG